MTGIGALLPVAPEATFGRSCPFAAIPVSKSEGSSEAGNETFVSMMRPVVLSPEQPPVALSERALLSC